MDLDLLMRIEEAALNAWPAPRQLLYDGWLLRFAGGHSKRVNSVNPLYASKLPLVEKIHTCESIYSRQGQPCLFRISELFETPDLINALQAAGYRPFDPTLVLGRKLDLTERGPADVTILEMPPADWFRLRSEFIRVTTADQMAHEAILESIVPEKVLVGLFINGHPLVCGMAVIEGSLLGFFSIYTASTWRRKGYGSLIMGALSDWGVERGAQYGYLQVEGDNEPALALYDALGFERCYQYVYYQKKELGD